MTTSTSSLRIAVILGSTRPGRNGAAVSEWVLEKAAGRTEAEYELIDLADHELPFLDEPVPASMQQYSKDHTRAWSEIIAKYDGFVFLTPEYNHAPSAVLKNAIDYLNTEWADKAAAFVSWGSFGGVRAVEQLRLILSELRVAHVRQSVGFLLATDFENYSEFTPGTHHDGEAETLFDQLESWARAMREVRASA